MRSNRKVTEASIQSLGLSSMVIDCAHVAMTAGADVRIIFETISQNLDSRSQCIELATVAEEKALQVMKSGIRTCMAEHGYKSSQIGFLLESTGSAVDKEHLFVFDPIDGLLNYTAGIPIYTLGIGYFHDGNLEASIVVEPETGVLYIAERGKGAYMIAPTQSVRRLHAVPLSLSECMCDIPANPPDTIRALLLHGLNNLSPSIRGMRMTGSSLYNLCSVAGNSLQFMCRRLELCDIAPGLLIVLEAGATVVDLDGTPTVLSLQYPQKLSLAVVCHPSLVEEALTKFHGGMLKQL